MILNFSKCMFNLCYAKSANYSCRSFRNLSIVNYSHNYVNHRYLKVNKHLLLKPTNLFESLYALGQQNRLKYTREKKSKIKNEDSDEESDEDNKDEPFEKNAKMITSYLSIPRVDAVIKAGLGIARSKADTLFYENKVRVNGYKVPKKSHRVHLDDEVDIIKSSTHEGNKLLVSRIILRSAKEVEDRDELKCQFKVFKTLEIDNYSDHPYRSHQSVSS